MTLFPLQRFTVSGNSMFPTLKPNQDVLVLCWFYTPKVGDIVVIKKDGKEMVKRIHYCRDHDINVIGDNESMSTDSRIFGLISQEDIVGKVIFVR